MCGRRKGSWRGCLLASCSTACLLTLVACSGEETSSGRGVSGSDSSEVAVVANQSLGAWAPGDEWKVEEVASVGGLEAEADYQFGRISGVDVDSDGNIYVTDRQAQNIRVFDASGALLRTIGRAGSGPGELGGNAAGVFVVDDRLLVPDLANQRISQFALDGSFLSSDRLDMAQGIPMRWDTTSRGRLIAQRRLMVPGNSTASSGDAIVTVPSGGQPVDTLAILERGQSVQITGDLPKIRQFEPEGVWDAGPDGRFVTAMNDAWRFALYGPDGTLERMITRPFQRRAVTDRDVKAVKAALRDMYRTQGVPVDAAEAVITGMEFADYFPAFASLVLGPQGSLWIQTLMSAEELSEQGATVAVKDMGSREWAVFAENGVYLGVVTFPSQFEPVRAVGDRFYGIARDELDVQSVKVLRVVID